VAVSLVIVNARIWTNDARRPWADALAVDGDRIAALGSSAEIMKRAGDARVIDANGGMVIPGNTDPRAELAQATSVAAVLAARGVLRTGASAELIVVDRDLTREALESMDAVRVIATVVGGAVVFAT
jgi:predicted amidohydrolase YtcJ